MPLHAQVNESVVSTIGNESKNCSILLLVVYDVGRRRGDLYYSNHARHYFIWYI